MRHAYNVYMYKWRASDKRLQCTAAATQLRVSTWVTSQLETEATGQFGGIRLRCVHALICMYVFNLFNSVRPLQNRHVCRKCVKRKPRQHMLASNRYTRTPTNTMYFANCMCDFEPNHRCQRLALRVNAWVRQRHFAKLHRQRSTDMQW